MTMRFAACAAALVMMCGVASAQDTKDKAAPTKAPAANTPTLKVGDNAPPLSINKWVKGVPVTSFEKGKIYVVEFWATWCGPCINAMPHLSELQAEYKDKGVTIIGVSSQDTRGNTLEAVEKMVADKGDVMAYTVAWDQERQTNAAWMRAAGARGIPTAFVVDREGKIAYFGHPMWLDIPLSELVSGTWDATKGPARVAAAEKKMGEIYMAARGDAKEALEKIEAFAKDYPGAAGMLDEMRYPLMVEAGDPEASAFGMKRVEALTKKMDAQGLNALAWGIVDPAADVKSRDLDLAMAAATKAAEFSNNKDAAILDTLARVQFRKGDVAKAIETQKRAVELAPEGLREELAVSLKEYENAKK